MPDPAKPFLGPESDVSELLEGGTLGLSLPPLEGPAIADLVVDSMVGDTVDLGALLSVVEEGSGFAASDALSPGADPVLGALALAASDIAFANMSALTIIFDDGANDPSISSI